MLIYGGKYENFTNTVDSCYTLLKGKATMFAKPITAGVSKF
jgi:hypothetical protein